MVFDFWLQQKFGPEFTLKQEYICNVARTSTVGTLSYDLVRTAHFSGTSRSVGKLFPGFELSHGFPHGKTGFAAFQYASPVTTTTANNNNSTIVAAKPWFEQLKAIVSLANVPVIVLTRYSYERLNSSGHYRVVVGYNDNNSTIFMADPWGREGNPPIVAWKYENFISAWSYIEHDSPMYVVFLSLILPTNIFCVQ